MFHWIYTHVPPWAYIAVISHLVILGTVAYLILLERKIASWVQDRIGPNRVGLDFGILPFKFLKRVNGFGQPLADGIKFIVKEDYQPKGVDKILFTIAPAVMIIVIVISIAVLPWGGTIRTTRDVDITGATETNDVEAVQANIVASGELLLPPPTTHGLYEIHGLKGTSDYRAPGTKALVTYEQSNAAGQTRRYTRYIDISGYAEKDENAAIRARLPADAVIVAQDPARAAAAGQVTVGVPVELRRDADGTFRHVATNVTYQWLFAAGKLNIGVLFILAVLSLAVYGVVVGGWASNNKYSFLGGLRATVNMISYEIPLGLTVLCVVLMFGSLDLNRIIDGQAGYWFGVIPAWNAFSQPLAFILFVVCIHAEANRAPFDTAEAEQELVGGYHTEYSAMRFALFFLAEYAGMITTSAVCVALFLGGWHLPYLDYIFPSLSGNVAGQPASVTTEILAGLVRAFVFFGKTIAIIFLFMWVRWSLPRFRFDQIIMLAWRGLIPISLALVMVTAVVIYLTAPRSTTPEQAQAFANEVLPFGQAVALFIANVVVLVVAMVASLFIPAAPATNRRMPVPGSRYRNTPVPGKTVDLATPAVPAPAAVSV